MGDACGFLVRFELIQDLSNLFFFKTLRLTSRSLSLHLLLASSRSLPPQVRAGESFSKFLCLHFYFIFLLLGCSLQNLFPIKSIFLHPRALPPRWSLRRWSLCAGAGATTSQMWKRFAELTNKRWYPFVPVDSFLDGDGGVFSPFALLLAYCIPTTIWRIFHASFKRCFPLLARKAQGKMFLSLCCFLLVWKWKILALPAGSVIGDQIRQYC